MSAPPSAVTHLPHWHRENAWKQPVRVASTADATFTTAFDAGSTVDGVTLAEGDRILIKDQSAGAQNGIYTVSGTAVGTPIRAYDMDTSGEFVGAHVYVVAGTSQGATMWRCTNTTAPTVDTTAITWEEFSGGGSSGTADVASDPIWDVKGDLAVGTAANAATRLAVGTNDYVLTADSTTTTGLKWAAATAAPADPIADIFGAADTAYEFATSSLTGLTAIGAPDTENADTTIPDCLYYRDDTSTTAWMGRYQASPGTPFTAIAKVLDFAPDANYNGAALIVGVADPTTGAFVTCSVGYNGGFNISAEKFTNRTTFSSTLANMGDRDHTYPIWLGMVVTNTTSITYYVSRNGWVWRRILAANNPSLTVGSVGLAMKSESATGVAVAFDFLRVWNSAKTFPF